MSAALLAASALAAGPDIPDPLCAPPPALPYGWRLDWGLAPGRNEASAIAAAQEVARARLLASACQGAGEMRCAAAARSIAPWGSPSFDKRRQSACTAMVIKLDALQSYEQDLKRLDSDLAALAAAIAAAAGPGALLSLRAPAWSSGCVAGDLGRALAAQLRNALAAQDLRLVAPGTRDPSAGVLSLQLAPGGERMTVSASYRPPGSAAERLLPGFTFLLDLYGISPSEVGRCADRLSLGLPPEIAPQTGGGGLSVSLFVPTNDGQICEGTRAVAEVYVNRPAHIQLWSVVHDGRAFLVGPDPTLVPGGLLTKGGPVLYLDALALESVADEWLIVVATPEGSPPPKLTAPCRGAQWSTALIPTNAALAAQTWTVLPEGTGGCGSWDGVASRAEVEGLLARLPRCATP